MTEEQIEELIKTLDTFKKADLIAAIIIGLAVILMLILCIYDYQNMKKKKQWIKEYKATLTKEQLEAVNRVKELNK